MREQRRQQRYPLQREVELVRDEQHATGVTENLSLGGAMIRAPVDPPWEVGQKLEISFRLPEVADLVRVDCEVRWINNIDPSCIGVQFTTGLRAKETWALNRLFDQLSREQGS